MESKQDQNFLSFVRNFLDYIAGIANVLLEDTKEKIVKNFLLIMFLLPVSLLLSFENSLDIEMGIKSYVGGYYYQNNDKKDFEYKSNHNWYLNIQKSLNDKIATTAEVRYYPEVFDKKLYLYSAKVEYKSNQILDLAWVFDRIGLGKDNFIYENDLNNIRNANNFISDYRFNGGLIKHKVSPNFMLSYLLGGNDHNTGIGALEMRLDKGNFFSQQSFILVSRDNRFNAKALNFNNQTYWQTNLLTFQNMLHFSLIDYYRKLSSEKANVLKNFTEARFKLSPNIIPELAFYYEVENWDKYKIYEVNTRLRFFWNKWEISPAYKFTNYLERLQREYSLIINFQLHPLWDIALNSEYFYTSNKQDIISYGLQTKFNFPLINSNIKSFFD